MREVIGNVLVSIAIAFGLFFAWMVVMVIHPLKAQGPPPPPTMGAAQVGFADVTPIPGQTIVVLRDPQGADQVIVTTFFWQNLPGLSQPILRSVIEVIPALKDVAVSAAGSPDPKRVNSVHLSLVKITGRMEWKPPASVPPAASPQAPVQ